MELPILKDFAACEVEAEVDEKGDKITPDATSLKLKRKCCWLDCKHIFFWLLSSLVHSATSFVVPKEQEALRRYESKFNEVRDGVHAGYNRKSFPWAMPQKVLPKHSRDPEIQHQYLHSCTLSPIIMEMETSFI